MFQSFINQSNALRIFLVFLLGSIAVINGCEKKQEIQFGDLYVSVLNSDSSAAVNAYVYTNPETYQANTDEFGSVLISGLPEGHYDVYASIDSVGSGKKLVRVEASALTEVTINIVDGLHYDEENLGIELFEPIVDNGSVSLRWSKYSGSNFQKYSVYRTVQGCVEQGLELVGDVTNINDTTLIDNAPPVEFQVCYVIRAFRQSEPFLTSNFYSVSNPSGTIFNFVASEMLKHPTQQIVYLIGDDALKLVKYDYINDQVLAETSLTGDVGYCDIGDNGFGVEIYVPSTNGNVYVYSGTDLSLSSTISTDLGATAVAVDDLGSVIVSVLPSPWWEDPIRTFSRSNGMLIDGGGERDEERLRRIPGSNSFISISEGVSPTDMNFYQFNTNGTFSIQTDDSYHGTYPLNAIVFRISENGEYVITSKDGAVYLANSNMLYVGNLESGGLEYSDFAFSSDGTKIYASTSDRKSIQIGNYPSLIRDDEIMLNGYPQHVIRDGNTLVSLITPEEENAVRSGLAVVEIP